MSDAFTMALQSRYPAVPWTEPIPVSRLDGLSRWGCRICIARDGLKGADVPGLFHTREEAEKHIMEQHL